MKFDKNTGGSRKKVNAYVILKKPIGFNYYKFGG